jgi:DNA ligase-1
VSKNFKPMLAGKIGDAVNFPVMASPKLDGVRCIIMNGVAMSRSLKPIPNAYVQKMIGKAKYNGLDGELLLGPVGAPDVYRKTVSAVMSEDGAPDFTFWIFDNFKLTDLKFVHRYESILSFNSGHVKVVQHKLIRTMEQLDAYEAKQLDDGLEGVMIRDPHGPYKQGRSTTREGYLLKLKRFEDSEAHIVDVQELLHNDNEAKKNALGHTERSSHKDNMVPMGTLGALLVKDIKTKVEFAIGTGYDAATRQELWDNRKSLKGKIVKYKYFAGGSKDRPRFPVFIGFRDKRDM